MTRGERRTQLPFMLDGRGVLDREPRAVFEEGAVFGAIAGEHDPRVVPRLAVAWLDEPAGVSLETAVDEDIARLLSDPGDLLLDREAVHLDGVEAVRTFTVHLGATGVPTASEQWRLLAAGRRWTVSATTALADQPEWGPRLAGMAASLRVR